MAANQSRSEVIASVRKFAIDKGVSLVFGVVGFVIADSALPFLFRIVGQYDFEFMLDYWEFCVVIVLITVVLWVAMWRFDRAKWIVLLGVSACSLLIEGLMRHEIWLASTVWLQFLAYFAGIVILIEAVTITFWQVVLSARSENYDPDSS